MARPKKDKPGKTISIWLTAEELEGLGDNPARTIKWLINSKRDPKPHPVTIETQTEKPYVRKLCTRCAIGGKPIKGCIICDKKG